MNTPSTLRSIGRCAAVAALAALTTISFADVVDAGRTACSIEFSTTDFTVYADAPDQVHGTAQLLFPGDWSTAADWFSVDDGAPVSLPGEGPIQPEFSFDIRAENIVPPIEIYGVELRDGETYDVTVWYTNIVSGSFVEGEMLCTVSYSVTYFESSPLPDTGSSSLSTALWATALLGMGAVSVLAASRRRA